MDRICLVADDLTGALDTAAELAPAAGSIVVRWDGLADGQAGSAAWDLGTREGPRTAAMKAAAASAAHLAGADLAFLKVDSLLRGHGMAELGAILSRGGFVAGLVAPAFPHQGRVTRGGVQFRRRPAGDWEAAADIVGLLAEAGIEARRATTGGAAPGTGGLGQGPRPAEQVGVAHGGVTVFDAEIDADLDRVAALGRSLPGPVLWCGSAGLASALARRAPPRTAPPLAGPVLGLFGSDQAATAAQLAACGPHRIVVPDGSAASAARVATALDRDGAALASLALPESVSRAAAAARIAEGLGALALRLPRPGTLLVAGGETLRALCGTLGAMALDVVGQIEPGLPVSLMRGGRWDGLRVVSKSGAFGGPTLWRDLIAPFLASADATP